MARLTASLRRFCASPYAAQSPLLLALSESFIAVWASDRAWLSSAFGSEDPAADGSADGVADALAEAVGSALGAGEAVAPPPAVGSLPSVDSLVSLAAPASPLTACSPVVAPELPPKTWSSAPERVSAKPTLSPKETSTLRSSGY